MQTKSIPSQWIYRKGLRLDSAPYMSGALEADMILKELPVPKIALQDLTKGGIAGIYHAGREGRLWVQNPEYGIPFMGSRDILTADLSNLLYLSKKQIAETPKFLIHEGWTLITRSGTVGRMAYARKAMDGLACSEHVIRVVPDEDKVLPGYLYAYLSTKFGIPLITSGTYGSVIRSIEPQHISHISVPRFTENFELEIHNLVSRAGDLLTDYQSLVNKATDNLFRISGIDNPPPHIWFNNDSDLGFHINISDWKGILRAWNHSRKVNALLKQIMNGKWNYLGDLTDFEWLRWRKMFERKDADPEFGLEVITQKPLFSLFPEGRWISKEYLLNHSPKYLVPDETILIAKQGTLGEKELYCRCEFITGERMLSKAYSDHCMRVVVKNESIHPGYLFAFLRSYTGFRILRSLSEGAKQQDLHWRTVPQIPIPRLREDEENSIGEMIREAYLYRNQAVENFIEARQLVENAIREAA